MPGVTEKCAHVDATMKLCWGVRQHYFVDDGGDDALRRWVYDELLDGDTEDSRQDGRLLALYGSVKVQYGT